MKVKLLMLILVSVILVTGVASAFEFDNNLDYEDNDLKVRITNAFGLGKELGTATLKSHSSVDEVLHFGFGKEEVVIYYDFRGWELYPEGLGEVYFIDQRTGKKVDKDYYFVERILKDVEVDTYKEVCGTFGNGTRACYQELSGTITKQVWTWKRLDSNDIPKGSTRIGLKTYVGNGDYMDAVWTIAGKKIKKHAVWDAGLNVRLQAYWKLNESSGELRDSLNEINMTAVATPLFAQPGIIGTGIGYDGNDDYFTNTTPSDTKRISFDTELDFSWNLWINSSENGADKGSVFVTNDDHAGGESPDQPYYRANMHLGGLLVNVGTTVLTVSNLTDREWHMVTFVRNDSGNGCFVYLDNVLDVFDLTCSQGNAFASVVSFGALRGSTFADHTLDEFSIWNRTLSVAEVNQLYNGGTGITFQPTEVSVTLDSPADNSVTVLTSVNFSATLSAGGVGGNLVNATLSLWFNNGSLFLTDTQSIVGETNVSNFTETMTVFQEQNYLWNVQTFNNLSETSSASANFTLGVRKFIENSKTFNANTIEGSTESFILNVTTGTTEVISSAIFDYNGTSNSVDISSGDFIILTSIINVPAVASNQTVNFQWNITLDSGAENSSVSNQTIQALAIDDCSSQPILILNYTLRDEDDEFFLNGSFDNTTIEVDVDIFTQGTTTQILNFSQKYTKANPAQVCLNANLSTSFYDLDAIVSYTASNRVNEHNNIQNFNLTSTSVPQNINLLLLNTSRSTEFQVTFKDNNLVVVEDALIQINRNYISQGVFKTVEIPKTDSNGQTVAHLVEKDIIYNIIVSKEGVILGTFNNLIAFCDDATIGSCFITLNALLSNQVAYDYDSSIGLAFAFDYNRTSRLLSFPFTTTDGSVKNVTMTAIKLDQLGNESVCFSSLVTSGGTLSCTVPASVGNETIIVSIFVDGTLRLISTITAGEDFDLGNEGYFLALILVLSLSLMFMESKAGVVIGVILGFVGSILFSFINGTLIGVGSSVIWLIIAGIILLFKLNKEGQT